MKKTYYCINIDIMTETPTLTQLKRIHYGFGLEYLPNWGIKEGLREIYQNFMDFGDYKESIQFSLDDKTAFVSITNSWEPKSLDFLRIGNSRKSDPANSVGKHGEGLKMAFLIFLREKLQIKLFTNKFKVYPIVDYDQDLGPCFALDYFEHGFTINNDFTIEFDCPKEIFLEFHNNIIKEEHILHTDNSYGDIVDKKVGNIYSGKLFVTSIPNFTKAYNIRPDQLPLDRDRAVPGSFDVEYACSKINESYDKWTAKELSFSDTRYVNKVPDRVKEEITPKIIGNAIEFTIKNEKGEDEVIKNTTFTEALRRDSFFQATIKKLKNYIAKKLGLYDLLLEFKAKHVHGADALADFEVILDRVSK